MTRQTAGRSHEQVMRTRRDAWRVLLPPGEASVEVRARRPFAVIPSQRDPRWYLPLDCRRQTAAAAALYHPMRPIARAAAAGVRIAARLGLLRWYPARIDVTCSERPALEVHLEELTGGADTRLAVYAGREDGARDTILAASVSTDGVVGALARVAVTDSGRCAVEREARALAFVAQHGIRAPRLLAAGEVGGRQVAVQQFVDGVVSSVGWTGEHDAVIADLRHGRRRRLVESAVTGWTADALTASPQLSRYLPLFRSAREGLADVAARPVVNHRDLAPWNMLWNEGRATLIDWEFAEIDGLPYLDRFYYELATGVHLRGWDRQRAERYLEEWAPPDDHGMSVVEARSLSTLLLLERLAWRLTQEPRADDLIATAIFAAVDRRASDSALRR